MWKACDKLRVVECLSNQMRSQEQISWMLRGVDKWSLAKKNKRSLPFQSLAHRYTSLQDLGATEFLSSRARKLGDGKEGDGGVLVGEGYRRDGGLSVQKFVHPCKVLFNRGSVHPDPAHNRERGPYVGPNLDLVRICIQGYFEWWTIT